MPSEAAAAAGERRLHPLTLVFATVGIARSMIWPAVAGGIGVGGSLEAALPIFLAVLAVPALIGAVVKYVFFRWRLTPDELVLDSGVLSRRNRVIPFARVQNVEVRQGPLQRVSGVAELRVETAGSGQEAEAVLAVLGAAEAQAVRAELLARRRGSAAAAETPEAPAGPPLAKLSTGDVLLAGATANEAGVIAAALAGLLQFADRLPFQAVESAADEVVRRTEGAMAAAVAGVVLAFLLLGWIISIGGALLRYHGFTLHRAGDELRKRYGLLTVHEGSVPLERVQAVRVEEPILRRALGFASLQIETAGGAPGQRGGAEAFVPIARRADVGRLVRGVFDDAEVDPVEFTRVHPRARRRIALRGLFVLLLLWLPFLLARWLDLHPAGRFAPWMAVLLPLPWLMARWQYRNRGWALAPGYLLARGGVMSRVTWIVPDRKLQTLHLRASPFQRRLGLTTLMVDTAAGGRQAVIVDLAEPVGRELLETLRDRVHAAGRASPGRARPAAARPATPQPEGLAQAADDNLVTHAAWVHRHAPSMYASGAGGVVVADSGLASPTRNRVLHARLEAEEAPARVREVVERFRAHGRLFTWRVGPADRPPGLGRHLRAAGLAPVASGAAMWLDLQSLRPGEVAPGGLRIVRVRSPEQLAAYGALSAAVLGDPQVARFYDAAAPFLLADGTPLRLYLGYLDGVPVAASELAVGGGVVGVYDLGTARAHRRRGFGTALATQPLLDAREEGARGAVVQPAGADAAIYARLGFEPFGEFTDYGTTGADR